MKSESAKPRLIEWLEDQTGKSLDPAAPAAGHDRHVSIRLPTALYERIEALAASSAEPVSQTIRRLLSETMVRSDHPDVAALDTAIATLQELRRRSA